MQGKKLTLGLLAAMLSTGQALATTEVTPYVGGQLGYQTTSMETSFSDNDFSVSEDGLAIHGFAGGALAGVRFLTKGAGFVSLEANYGISNAEYEFGRSDIDYKESETFEADTSYGIAMIAGSEISESARFFGRVGYQTTTYEYSYKDDDDFTGTFKVSDDEDFSGIRFGIGAEIDLNPTVAIRLDWNHTLYSSETFESEGFEFELEPTDSLVQLGLIANF